MTFKDTQTRPRSEREKSGMERVTERKKSMRKALASTEKWSPT